MKSTFVDGNLYRVAGARPHFYRQSLTVHSRNAIPPGKRFSVENLPTPMGMVLVEEPDAETVVVEEVKARSSAATAGIQVGDLLLEVSAVTLKAGKEGQYQNEGYGQRPFDSFEKSMMNCVGQSFDTVLSAIASNNPRWGFTSVDLIILRPDEKAQDSAT